MRTLCIATHRCNTALTVPTDHVHTHAHTQNRVATPTGFTLESSGSGDDVFTIMPATFEPGKKGPFHLSVVCDAEFRLTRDRGGGQRASVVGSAAAAAGATGSATGASSGADGAAGSSSSKHHKGGSSRHSAKQPSSTATAVAPAPVATTAALAATTTTAVAATAVTGATTVSAAATSALIDGVAPLPSLHKQPSANAAATLGVVTSPFANTAVAAGVSTRRGSPGGMR
jgi:hypothetical protein